MGAWIHTCFIDGAHNCYHDSLVWDDVDHYLDDYENTAYWWSAEAKNDYIPQWNNACAIYLIIQKCNAMQAQIDEMSGGEVTMSAILEAMLAAEYEEFQDFIGYIDGYRVALMDKWFNADYYAALARGFKERAP